MNAGQEKRFWQKVKKTRSCWIWTGARLNGKYGMMFIGPHRYSRTPMAYAHRLSYELHFGSPGNLQVCHKCDVPECVNPRHLFLGNQTDNMIDKVSKDRQLKGTYIWSAKLTESQIKEIRALRGRESQYSIAKRFGIAQTTVCGIQLHKRWRHVP